MYLFTRFLSFSLHVLFLVWFLGSFLLSLFLSFVLFTFLYCLLPLAWKYMIFYSSFSTLLRAYKNLNFTFASTLFLDNLKITYFILLTYMMVYFYFMQTICIVVAVPFVCSFFYYCTGDTLWHLQNLSQYIIVEFSPSIILLYSLFTHFWNSFNRSHFSIYMTLLASTWSHLFFT
jgi:hypothetical protein